VAKERQRHYVNKKRRHVEYSVGDKVILSIKYFPIKQQWSTKLLLRFVGPFSVVKRIEEIACRLELPSYLRIHDVFHV
jgi:hypothetical protein